MENPWRDPEVLVDIERKAEVLKSCSAGKILVEFNLKDGRWTPGNVSVTFPRRHRE